MENNQPPVPPDNNNDINNQFNQQFGGNQNQGIQPNVNPVQQPITTKPDLPNATAALVLGIIGIVLSLVWCYYITTAVGLILDIIAIILGSGAVKIFNSNPGIYSDSSASQARTGKILGIIGLVLAILWILFIVLAIFVWAAAVGSMFRM